MHAGCIQVESWGYPTIAVSAAGGVGLDRLLEVLSGRVSIFAGPSGVGKSSLINALKLRAAREAGPGAAGARLGSSPEPATSWGSGSNAATSCSSSNGSSSGNEGPTESLHERAIPGESAALQDQHRISWEALAEAGHDRHAAAETRELRSENGASSTGQQPDCSGVAQTASPKQGFRGADAESRRAEQAGPEVGVISMSAGVVDPLEQWRDMQEDAQALGLQPVGDLTAIGRGKHTTRHVSLLGVRRPPVPPHALLHTLWGGALHACACCNARMLCMHRLGGAQVAVGGGPTMQRRIASRAGSS